MQPLDQCPATCVTGVYHGSRWERPITMHIHAANEALEGDQHSVYVREELGMFVLYRGNYGDTRVKVAEIVVVFVRLIHEILAIGQAKAAIEAWDDSAYKTVGIEARVQ